MPEWTPRQTPGVAAAQNSWPCCGAGIHDEVDLGRCVREEATILATLSRDMLKCCCLPLRHPFGNSQANPQIKFHGIDPCPSCAHCIKEIGGRFLLRPRTDYSAATVADFSTVEAHVTRGLAFQRLGRLEEGGSLFEGARR